MDPGYFTSPVHFTLAVTDETLQDTQLAFKLIDIPLLRLLSLIASLLYIAQNLPPGYSLRILCCCFEGHVTFPKSQMSCE